MADNISTEPVLQPVQQWNPVPFDEVSEKYNEFFQAAKTKIDTERQVTL